MTTPFYNNGFATVGLRTFALGSSITFEQTVYLNGLLWDLTGGSATLILSDPLGNTQQLTGTIAQWVTTVNWTASGSAGNWTKAWKFIDATGRTKIDLPTAFGLISSPV